MTLAEFHKSDITSCKFVCVLIYFLDSFNWNLINHNFELDLLGFNDFGPLFLLFVSVLGWQSVAVIKIYYKIIMKKFLTVYAIKPTECRLQKN